MRSPLARRRSIEASVAASLHSTVEVRTMGGLTEHGSAPMWPRAVRTSLVLSRWGMSLPPGIEPWRGLTPGLLRLQRRAWDRGLTPCPDGGNRSETCRPGVGPRDLQGASARAAFSFDLDGRVETINFLCSHS